jgi:hypothetical protein
MQALVRGSDEGVGVGLRRATAADGPALVSLARNCPMQGEVALRIDRAPDFFALARCRGDGYTLVGDEHGQIVACVSVARRAAYIHGKRTVIGYVGDMKVRLDRRGSGLARRLLAEIDRLETAATDAFYTGTTAAGNVAVGGVLARFANGHPLVRVGGLVAYQLLPVLRLRPRRGVAIACAGARDEDELAAFLDNAHRKYVFGPVFRDGGLQEILARSPGMSLSNYFVARRGGRIVAALGVWDQHRIKQTHVLRMTRSLRWLSTAMRAGALLRLPTLPREGEELRFRYARHPAGETGAVAALVRHALAEARARRDHFLLFTCAVADPLSGALAGIPRTAYRYDLVAGKNRPGQEGQLRALSAGLPYDDAALA